MTSCSQLQQAAARELLIRRRARADVLDYANAIDIPGAPTTDDPDTEFFKPVETTLAAHHRLFLTAIEETSRTRHGRLMIFAPPGSAKSSYASVVFPSKYLGQQPDRRLILSSYGDDLARKMGRRVRSIVKQPRYRGIFNATLTAESSAAQEFSLTNRSEFMAAGILSGITGNRAHGIIIDDPVKGREQANSDAVSDKTWNAYNADLKTRLIPGGWIVLIQTRWSEKDLAGRILPEGWNGQSGVFRCQDGQDWRILSLQARCETDTDPLGRAHGEYLWTEWFDRKHWAQFENLPRTWASLYQQIPSPGDGDLFQPDQIQIVDALPAGVTRWVRGWDLGSTVDGDWTRGGLIGAMPDGRFIIADMASVRDLPHRRDFAIKNTVHGDGHLVEQSLPQDPGQAGKSQIAYMVSELAGYRVHTSTETGDKTTRAEPLSSQVNVGNVLMLRGPWNKPLIEEMRMFPNGKYDDQVDALGRAFNKLVADSGRQTLFG